MGASGVAGLMASAGLTHGGFYSHFSSKDALIEEALRDAIEQVRAWIGAVAETEREQVRSHRARLSERRIHRDNPETGCVAGGARTGNRDAIPRSCARCSRRASSSISRCSPSLLPASATPEARRSVATAIIAGTIGMIQLARAVDDEELSDQILEDGIAACLSLARAISA